MITDPLRILPSIGSEIRMGAFLPGICAVVTTISALAILLRNPFFLFLFVIFGLFNGIASGFAGIGSAFHFNEFRAKAHHFLLHCRTRIEHFHHSAQSSGRGDSLQPCNPCTQYQYFRRSDAALPLS